MKQWLNFKQYESSFALFAASLAIIMLGLSYISVPLYQIYCQTYGIGGTVQKINYNTFLTETEKTNNISQSKKDLLNNVNKNNSSDSLNSSFTSYENDCKNLNSLKTLTIYLNAENSHDLPWVLKPSISKIKVYPGDTSLIFYLAHNLSNQPITGVATYNIMPARAGVYFNKIQCFCFEEQRLKGNETIELPVLFFIDSEFLKDPKMSDIDSLTLSYTFFKTNDLFSE